jgi:hypothetical protein
MKMTSGYIPNFLSNSKEFLNKFGKQIIDAANEVKTPKKFVNDVREAMDANIKSSWKGPTQFSRGNFA